MYSNEELLTDEGYRQLNGNQQHQLIVKHCRDLEERIQSAATRMEALRIGESACSQIEKTCQSMLIRKELVRHVEILIARYWNTPD